MCHDRHMNPHAALLYYPVHMQPRTWVPYVRGCTMCGYVHVVGTCSDISGRKRLRSHS